MIIGQPPFQYRWHDRWAKIPPTSDGRTHGVVVTRSDYVIVCHQANPAVLLFAPSGELVDSWGDFPGAHGLTLVEENGREFLWLADAETPAVVKTSLAGDIVQRLEKPQLPIYAERNYSPTWVAVNPSNGDIWVADGYGSHQVHRYRADGVYLMSIDGTEGRTGAFDCPHGIWVDVRRKGGDSAELYIADRSHRRIQVYDLDGNYLRCFGQAFMTSPCSFVASENHLFIPELIPRITVLDADDKPIAYLGENDGGFHVADWPNLSAERLQIGKFNSPHGIAANSQGDLFIVEWIIGGRITKLEQV